MTVGGGEPGYHRAGDRWAAGFGVVYVAHLRREALEKEKNISAYRRTTEELLKEVLYVKKRKQG